MNLKNKIKFQTEEQVVKMLKEQSLYGKYERMNRRGKQLFMNFCTGKSLEALTYDAIFKRIFQYEKHPKRLEHFLSAILGFPVQVMKVLPVESEKMLEAGSVLIMDIVVKAVDGSIVNVEMQKSAYKFTGKRDSCYLSDLLIRQYNELKAKSREENSIFTYESMQPVYSIIILEKSYKNMLDFGDVWEHTGKMTLDSGLEMNYLQNVKYILLDIYKKVDNNIDTEKKKWVYLLSANTPEEVLKAASLSEEMFEIIVEVSQFVMDVGEVMNMFSEALYMLDRNTEKLMYDEAIENLDKVTAELDQKKEELDRTSAELNKTNAELNKTSAELNKTNAELDKTSVELNKTNAAMEQLKQEHEEVKRRSEWEKCRADVYQLLLQGKTEAMIAAQLGLSIEEIEKIKNS